MSGTRFVQGDTRSLDYGPYGLLNTIVLPSLGSPSMIRGQLKKGTLSVGTCFSHQVGNVKGITLLRADGPAWSTDSTARDFVSNYLPRLR